MKHKAWIWLAVLAVPALVFGAEHAEAAAAQYEAVAGRSTDFIPRIFNFLIFAGLTYYLVASPLKSFFVKRRDGIAEQLNEIERKLQEAKTARKQAEQAVETSKSKAAEAVSTVAMIKVITTVMRIVSLNRRECCLSSAIRSVHIAKCYITSNYPHLLSCG